MSSTLYPYDVLAKHRIHPHSSVSSIQDFIPTEREESEAWQLLREMRTRLRADFFLYHTRDEDRLARFQEQLNRMTTVPHASLVQSQLADDAPVVMLLAGERQAAKTIWEELLQKEPDNIRTVHRLALLSYAEAQQYEEERQWQQAVTAWQDTILHWVRTLADDNYWSDWYNERRRCYQDRSQQFLKIGFKTAVRNDLHKHLMTVLIELVDRYAQGGTREQSEAYANLLALYSAERSGANALKAAGGIRLSKGYSLVCGPLLLKKLRLTHKLPQLIDELQEDLRRYQALPATRALDEGLEPKVSSATINLLRIFFSSLATVAAKLDLNRPNEAQEALAVINAKRAVSPVLDELYAGIKGGSALYDRDVAELVIQSHITLARQYLTSVPPNLNATESAWRDVMKSATQSDLRKSAAQAICDLALGRADALETEIERDLTERLNESIEILERARSVLRGLNSDEVSVTLAEKLSLRGKQHELEDDCETAVDDLRRAFDLAPDDVYIRDQYCFYLVRQALERVANDLESEALTILERAKNLAEQGLLDYPDDEDLKRTLGSIQVELHLLLEGNSEGTAWDALDQALQRVKPPSADYTLREKVKEAEDKRENGDYIGATHLIEQVLAQTTDYAWAKAEAVETYAQWGLELLEAGNIEEAARKAQLGAQYGVSSLHLQQLQEGLAGARRLLER